LYFAIGTDSRNDLFISSASGEDYTISIIGIISDIKTIDPKFLPEGIGYDNRVDTIVFECNLHNAPNIRTNFIKISNSTSFDVSTINALSYETSHYKFDKITGYFHGYWFEITDPNTEYYDWSMILYLPD
jgi:hypothetical protein